MSEEQQTQAIVPAEAKPIMSEEQVNLAVMNNDYANLTQAERNYVRLVICRRNNWDPLTNALQFIPDGKGGLKLYAGKAAAKAEKVNHKLTVQPMYMGPLRSMSWDAEGKLQLGDIAEPRLFVSIWKATSEELGDTYDGSALALDKEVIGLENAFKKFLTQGTNRVIFSAVGNPFMDQSESEDMGKGFAPPSAPPPAVAEPRRRVPAPKPAAEIAEQPIPVVAVPVGEDVTPAKGTPQVKLDDGPQGVVAQPQAQRVIPKVTVPGAPVAAPQPAPGPQAARVATSAGASPAAVPGPRPVPAAPKPAVAAPVQVQKK